MKIFKSHLDVMRCVAPLELGIAGSAVMLVGLIVGGNGALVVGGDVAIDEVLVMFISRLHAGRGLLLIEGGRTTGKLSWLILMLRCGG